MFSRVGTSLRAYSTNSKPVVHKLPQLSYGYGELEPVISGKVLELHHGKHHQTYVNNLNAALEKVAANPDLEPSLRKAINFNGGGHLIHSFFWSNLAPKNKEGGVLPNANSALTTAINQKWGSYEKLIEAFNATTVAVQGSGWGWVAWNPISNELEILTTSNQDLVETVKPVVPILTVDVWEHAYYIDYENRRAEFLNKIWQVINWKTVEDRFNVATKKY